MGKDDAFVSLSLHPNLTPDTVHGSPSIVNRRGAQEESHDYSVGNHRHPGALLKELIFGLHMHINLIMKPSLYLDPLMDFEQIYIYIYISLSNHSGSGVENGLEEK